VLTDMHVTGRQYVRGRNLVLGIMPKLWILRISTVQAFAAYVTVASLIMFTEFWGHSVSYLKTRSSSMRSSIRAESCEESGQQSRLHTDMAGRCVRVYLLTVDSARGYIAFCCHFSPRQSEWAWDRSSLPHPCDTEYQAKPYVMQPELKYYKVTPPLITSPLVRSKLGGFVKQPM